MKALIFSIFLVPTLSFAAEPPVCNDKRVKDELLNRHFLAPKLQTLQAMFHNQSSNPNKSAWEAFWRGKVENVRQDSVDQGSNSRMCSADLTTAGGPPANMNVLFIAIDTAFCLDNTLSYRIQVTEDGDKVYVTSRCSVPPAATTMKGYVESERRE